MRRPVALGLPKPRRLRHQGHRGQGRLSRDLCQLLSSALSVEYFSLFSERLLYSWQDTVGRTRATGRTQVFCNGWEQCLSSTIASGTIDKRVLVAKMEWCLNNTGSLRGTRPQSLTSRTTQASGAPRVLTTYITRAQIGRIGALLSTGRAHAMTSDNETPYRHIHLLKNSYLFH